MSSEHIIIIGSGPAALTAALYTARAGLAPLVVEGKEPGGQLMWTNTIANWPGSLSVTGPQLIMDMRKQALNFGTRFLSQYITRVTFDAFPLVLTTHKQERLAAQAVIVATGSHPKRLGCPGEDMYWGKGVGICAVCDGAFYRNMPVVIVGGGNRALENALFMTHFTNDITLVYNTSGLTATQALVTQVQRTSGIKLVNNSTLSAIEGDENSATGVIIRNVIEGKERSQKANGIFVSIGSTPNTEPFVNALKLSPEGYILVKDHTVTSCTGVFAAGDVADARYRQAITSAAMGCMAALDAEKFLKQRAT